MRRGLRETDSKTAPGSGAVFFLRCYERSRMRVT